MKVLVIGQGGREHALLWKLKQSKDIKELFSAPGNGGTAEIAENVDIKANDLEGLSKFCEDKKIDFTIVGPEAPLAEGIVDLFNKKGLKIFGPTKASAQLEASKVFTKELCESEKIPTAWFKTFNDAQKAKDFVKSKGAPIVIKKDGLAEGKGVIVANTEAEAIDAIDKIVVEKAFGASGNKVIVEECLEGEEASVIVLSDGENIVPLASSQDHKRVFDQDKGANTGGMGAYSPAPVVTDDIFNETISKIIKPTIAGMKKRNTPHKGVLYAGIMITEDGPKLLEYNVRFGDPETQAILPRLDSDLLELIERAMSGSLADFKLKWRKKSCACIVMASGGYPGRYEKGKEITGIEKARELQDVLVFHAGTKLEKTNKILTSGGRVLNVVALGDNIEKAISTAYKACDKIKFDNAHFRKDIGFRAMKQEVL
ncbi:MAG: phosphoribosylamine--glycine ligase [Candidatus Omnitrophica bacterium]|nr:phosphoribosylamine--glycine ligase [Candidatus Omnitrophota bacterium]